MLFRNGLPHINASLRYGVLEKYLDGLWKKKSIVANIKRRYVLQEESQSMFNEHVTLAARQLEELRHAFEAIVLTLPSMRPSARLLAVLGSIDLCLNSRVAHRSALLALLHLQGSIQLVRLNGTPWFEWSYANPWRDGRPVFRIEVSDRASSLIAAATSGKNALRDLPAPPSEVEELCKRFCGKADLNELIQKMCTLQDQLNVLHLPGIDAAYLAGRAVLCALPLRDWYRVTKGSCAQPPWVPEEPEVAVDGGSAAYVIERRKFTPADNPTPSTPKKCRDLFDKILDALKGKDPSSALSAVERAVSASGYAPGDAPWIFGSYICHLLTRKPKKHGKDGRDRLRVQTVQRAWYCLAAPLSELAHDINLCDLDEEELTGLYSDLIDWWDQHFDADLADQLAGKKSEQTNRLTHQERVADAARECDQRI